MSFLDKLFGWRKPPVEPTPAAPPAAPRNDPNLIRVFDSYGRELFISREEWRANVLPGSIRQAWDNADALYQLVVTALDDGFRADVLDAARRLHAIDPTTVRGACVWGIVLMEEGRLDEAEAVFREHIARHGEEGVILTNLAKIFAKRGDAVKAEEILWRGLELDPNQDNAVSWFEAIHRERGGGTAGDEALRRVAALTGSWRAQLWLARGALAARQLERALDFYRECLARMPRPAPGDLLMQIGGDLGNAGHLPELLALTEPHFDPIIHGLQGGNNLIKAHVDLGQLDAAEQILNRLLALQRPDWRETLSFWETEIAKARLDPAPAEPGAIEMTMLAIHGPVWLRADSPAADLFPARAQDGPLVAFLGSSAERATNSQRIEHQLADTRGRVSRALPLFFAEQLEFATTARAQILIPWIVSPSGAFMLSGTRWSDEDAAGYARQSEPASEFVATLHLKTQSDPWTLELRLVRTIHAKCAAEWSARISPECLDALPDLTQQLCAAIVAETGARTVTPPAAYEVPALNQLANYLVRLEQLLAVRCAAMEGAAAGRLVGEREIIDGNIQLCVEQPGNVSTRVLLAQTLLAMKRARPGLVPEFGEKLALLQREKPLPSVAQAVVQRLIDEALAGA